MSITANGATVNTTSAVIKTLAQCMASATPYLSEGVEELDAEQLAGKRVGEEYAFTRDDNSVAVGEGMQTPTDNFSSTTEKIKIWNASVVTKTSALEKKLACGDWVDYCKKMGVKMGRELAEKVALSDMGKISKDNVYECSSVADLVAKMNICNDWASVCYGYGAYEAVGKILSTSKQNIPVVLDDSYANGDSYKVGVLSRLRNLKLPVTKNVASLTIAVDADGAGSSSVSAPAGSWKITTGGASASKGDFVKVNGKNVWVYFCEDAASGSTSDTKKMILIGDKSDLTATGVVNKVYAPIIVRSEGSEGKLDATSLIEAKDDIQTADGMSIAITKIKNDKRGIDEYLDTAMALGVADSTRQGVFFIEV